CFPGLKRMRHILQAVHSGCWVDGMLRAGGDAEAVPYVDRSDRDGQPRNFGVGEKRAQRFEGRIGYPRLRNIRHSLGPGKHGTFTYIKDTRLMPYTNKVDPLLAEAVPTRLFHMHVDAIGTPIQLGRAKLDQMQESSIKSG